MCIFGNPIAKKRSLDLGEDLHAYRGGVSQLKALYRMIFPCSVSLLLVACMPDNKVESASSELGEMDANGFSPASSYTIESNHHCNNSPLIIPKILSMPSEVLSPAFQISR